MYKHKKKPDKVLERDREEVGAARGANKTKSTQKLKSKTQRQQDKIQKHKED